MYFDSVYTQTITNELREMQFGPWNTLALNLDNGPLKDHVDSNNAQDDLSFIMLWGKFKGGSVRFQGLKTTLHLQPGDVYACRAGFLTHSVSEYSGQRYSTVFFTQQQCVSWAERLQKTKNLPESRAQE